MNVWTFNLTRDWRRQLEEGKIEADRLGEKYVWWAKLFLRKAIEAVLQGTPPPMVSVEEYRWIRIICDLVILDETDIGRGRMRYTPVLFEGGNGTHIFRLTEE